MTKYNSKVFPELKTRILQMSYQNVQERSHFTVERKKYRKFSIYRHVSHQSKIVNFSDSLNHNKNHIKIKKF